MPSSSGRSWKISSNDGRVPRSLGTSPRPSRCGEPAGFLQTPCFPGIAVPGPPPRKNSLAPGRRTSDRPVGPLFYPRRTGQAASGEEGRRSSSPARTGFSTPLGDLVDRTDVVDPLLPVSVSRPPAGSRTPAPVGTGCATAILLRRELAPLPRRTGVAGRAGRGRCPPLPGALDPRGCTGVGNRWGRYSGSLTRVRTSDTLHAHLV